MGHSYSSLGTANPEYLDFNDTTEQQHKCEFCGDHGHIDNELVKCPCSCESKWHIICDEHLYFCGDDCEDCTCGDCCYGDVFELNCGHKLRTISWQNDILILYDSDSNYCLECGDEFKCWCIFVTCKNCKTQLFKAVCMECSQDRYFNLELLRQNNDIDFRICANHEPQGGSTTKSAT